MTEKGSTRKIRAWIGSMPFAITLLILLAAACALSSLVTQGQSYSAYAAQYGERTAAVILALGADDAYHSWWFIGISALLCLNLVICSVSRLPGVIRRARDFRNPEKWPDRQGPVRGEGIRDPEKTAKRIGITLTKNLKTAENRPAMAGVRNTAGIWGAWVCHAGILLLIAGFALGQITMENYTVYGVAGETKKPEGTDLQVTIDAFEIDLRDDDTVEQYTTRLTAVREADGQQESGTTSVNHPARLFGYTFYQNSTGYAGTVRVLKNGEPLQEQLLYVGEVLGVADKPELTVYLQAFYPDYVYMQGAGPGTASGQMRNPAWLYRAYYRGEMLGMNVLMGEEELTIDEYTITFHDPQSYTLLAVKRDRFSTVALAGGILTMLGFLLAFYVQPTAVWAVQREDGSWEIHGRRLKNGVLFREQFERAVKEDGGSVMPPYSENEEPMKGAEEHA